MPSSGRISALAATVRRHPIILATTATTGGVMLGAFVILQMFTTPLARTALDGAVSPAVQSPKAESQTTGSAPTSENVASVECGQQTWPYLSQACMEELKVKNNSPRAVLADKKTVAVTRANTAPTAPDEPPLQADESVPAATVVVAPPPLVTAAPAASSLAVTKNEAKDKHFVAKKIRRKPNAQRPSQRLYDDHLQTNPSMDTDSRSRADRRAPWHIVERWIERDYDAQRADGRGRRRVTVIGHRGGPVENLFGMGRGGVNY